MRRIDGRFKRVPTGEPSEGSFAISHRWVPEKLERRRSTGRWCRVTNHDGRRSIFRVLTFDPTLSRAGELERTHGGTEGSGELVIDWAGWLLLTDYAEDTPTSAALEITPARWWNLPRIATTHPNPVSRVALQVSAVAFLLGVIPFIVALVGWIAAWEGQGCDVICPNSTRKLSCG